MPTEEERRRQWRNGYDPNGYPGQKPIGWGGVWDTVRNELNAMAGSNPEGRKLYEEGRDAITGRVRNFVRSEASALANSPPGRLVGDVVSRVPAAAREIAGTYNTAMENLAAMHSDEDTRSRRLAQAGIPLAPAPAVAASVPYERRPTHTPVMAQQPLPEIPQERTGFGEPVPQQAPYGGAQETQPPVRESSSVKVQSGPAPFRKGIGEPIPVAASDREYMGPAPATDPRKRYYDMANMSLEQRESFLNSLPEGQRPIQTIRGNREGWYNPSLSKEFATLPEAMSGVEGRPTYKSEEARREESLDRQALMDTKRYQSDMVYRAHVDSASIHAASQSETAKSGAKALAAEPSWKTVTEENTDANGNAVKTPWLYNEKNPAQRFPLTANSDDFWASEISKGFDDPERRIANMTALKYLDKDRFMKVMGRQPEEVQKYYRQMFKEEADRENKKAKGK